MSDPILHIGLHHYLVLSLAVFLVGAAGVLKRKNLLVVFMSIELMLNAANIAFLAFARFRSGGADAHVVVLFIIAVAAVEAAVGLAILVALYRRRGTVRADEIDMLSG